MSEVMLFGVLRMPYEMAMHDELSRRQFYSRAQEAADTIEQQKAEIANLKAENEFSYALIMRQRDLLTRTVNILRGEPGPLSTHSHHDIPELVESLRAQIAELRSHIRTDNTAVIVEAEKRIEQLQDEDGNLRSKICERDFEIASLRAQLATLEAKPERATQAQTATEAAVTAVIGVTDAQILEVFNSVYERVWSEVADAAEAEGDRTKATNGNADDVATLAAAKAILVLAVAPLLTQRDKP